MTGSHVLKQNKTNNVVGRRQNDFVSPSNEKTIKKHKIRSCYNRLFHFLA